MTRAAVILGASGRLGRRLLPAFTAAGFDTIGVARASRSADTPDAGRWIAADLAVPADRARTARIISAYSVGRQQVCVVDAVLDRRGVDAMRSSVRGATDMVLLLRDQLSGTATSAVLVAASTTAVLAPGLFQTPYGLAKRRQVITYARSGMAGAALLLPLLAEPSDMETPDAPYSVWSFEQAAGRLAAIPTTVPSDNGFSVHVSAVTVSAAAERVAQAGSAALVAHLNSMVADRNSMQAHRDAARARLRLSPHWCRPQVDHHLAPVGLVRRFANRYHVSVIDVRTTDQRIGREGIGDA